MRKRNFKIIIGVLFFGFALLLANLNKESYTPVSVNSIDKPGTSFQTFQNPAQFLQLPAGGSNQFAADGFYNTIPDLPINSTGSTPGISIQYSDDAMEEVSNNTLAYNSELHTSINSDAGASGGSFAPMSISFSLPQKGKLWMGKKSESKNIARTSPFNSSLGTGPMAPQLGPTPDMQVPLDNTAWIIIIGAVLVVFIKLYAKHLSEQKATLSKIHPYNQH